MVLDDVCKEKFMQLLELGYGRTVVVAAMDDILELATLADRFDSLAGANGNE